VYEVTISVVVYSVVVAFPVLFPTTTADAPATIDRTVARVENNIVTLVQVFNVKKLEGERLMVLK
jgi:hypothetical protein